MSLKESRALNGVDPWLAVRVQWLGQVIEAWGGVQIYLSGVRTREEQQVLYDRVRNRPVAAPGCSQHQYGYAVDVTWGLLREFSPLGDFSPVEINELMSELGQRIGLVTVQNDRGHFQIFPGAEFRPWAVDAGFCQKFPLPPRPRSQAEEICGIGSLGFTRVARQDAFGFECGENIFNQ